MFYQRWSRRLKRPSLGGSRGGLLDEIRDGAISETTSLEEVLRRCVLLGHRLRYEPLKTWAMRELNGYPTGADVPDYRVIRGVLQGEFVFGFNLVSNYVVPASLFSESEHRAHTQLPLAHGIAELAAWSQQVEPFKLTTGFPLMAEWITAHIDQYQHCVSVGLSVSPSHVKDVLSQIRNRILEFVMELEGAVPEANDGAMSVTPQTTQAASQIFHTTIYASGSNLSVGGQMHVQQVIAGDLDGLRKLLVAEGADDRDVTELARALDEGATARDLEDESTKAGSLVKRAATKMAGKAGGIIFEAAKQLAVKAALSYAGLA